MNVRDWMISSGREIKVSEETQSLTLDLRMPDGVCSLKPSQKGQREDPVGVREISYRLRTAVGDETCLLQPGYTQKGAERRT